MAEQWQLGDVVRNADDETDHRSWAFVPDEEGGSLPWARLFAYDLDWDARDHMPANLELLVRNGRNVESGGRDV
jgi:hypothetical protein